MTSMTPPPPDATALGPYRVLDLTGELGFMCGKMLGDLGADVIKVEPPGGDPARALGPFYHDERHPDRSLYWFALNTSKRGVTLDLEKPDGRALFAALVRTADFVIESFPPGYLNGLKLGYDDLARINPAIVMTSITAFGQTGPYAHYRASDIVGVAMGGLMWLCGDPDRAPLRIRPQQGYFQASIQAVVATMLAHHYRVRTGEGQHVDVSMQEAVTWTLIPTRQWWDLHHVILTRAGPGRPSGRRRIRVIFPCKDGYVAVFGVVGRELPTLAAWLREEGMEQDLDGAYWTELAAAGTGAATQEDLDHIATVIEPFVRRHTKQELYEEGQRRRIIVFPVNEPADFFQNPQLAARDYFVRVEHPELGAAITYPGAPFKMHASPWRIHRRAPLVGEHNREVYAELGIDADRLADLIAAGVI
jgi:benzylsuccinate CoA-transferase BbsE subunit